MDYVIFIALVLILLVFLGIAFGRRVKAGLSQNSKKIEKNRYKDSSMDRMMERFMKNNFFHKVVGMLAYRLYSVNRKGLVENYSKAFRIWIIYLAVMGVISVIIMASNELWYIGVLYVGTVFGFTVGIYFVFISLVKMKLNKYLPETFKMINSKFEMNRDIKKSMKDSMDGLKPPMKKLVGNMVAAMDLNDMENVEYIFKKEEENFNNVYVTLLIKLISQAYYRGGDEVLVERFEAVTREVEDGITRSKGITAATRSSIILTLITIPIMLGLVEWVSDKINLNQLTEFYTSPVGVTAKLGLFLVTVLYILFLVYMEHSNTQ